MDPHPELQDGNGQQLCRIPVRVAGKIDLKLFQRRDNRAQSLV
jgi:hypothetical protein